MTNNLQNIKKDKNFHLIPYTEKLYFKPLFNPLKYWNNKISLISLKNIIVEINIKRNNDKYSTYSVTNDKGLIDRKLCLNQNDVESENNKKEKMVPPDYFVYSPARVNVGSIVYNKENKVVCVSGSYVIFKNNNKNFKNEYLLIIFKSFKFIQMIRELTECISATVRNKCDFKSFNELFIPNISIQEQEKIIIKNQNINYKLESFKTQTEEIEKQKQETINFYFS